MRYDHLLKDDRQRRIVFEMLVLRALWVIVLLIVSLLKSRAWAHQVADVNTSLIDYGDTFGIGGEQAKEYRQREQFPSAYR